MKKRCIIFALVIIVFGVYHIKTKPESTKTFLPALFTKDTIPESKKLVTYKNHICTSYEEIIRNNKTYYYANGEEYQYLLYFTRNNKVYIVLSNNKNLSFSDVKHALFSNKLEDYDFCLFLSSIDK